jgi:hypothetical protein
VYGENAILNKKKKLTKAKHYVACWLRGKGLSAAALRTFLLLVKFSFPP